MNPYFYYMVPALVLLALGLFGALNRRTLVGMLIGVELMLSGAGLSIMAAARFTPATESIGQVAVLFVMGLAAAETTLFLAILIVCSKRCGNVETDTLSTLKG